MVFVDGGGWAVKAVLSVNLSFFAFFVLWFAVLVFSGNVAGHSIKWYDFLLSVYGWLKVVLLEKLGWHFPRSSDGWIESRVRVVNKMWMMCKVWS